MALGSTQPLTEMSNRSRPGGKRRPALSMSRLSRNYGSLDVSQPYRPPRPVTGIASHFISYNWAIPSVFWTKFAQLDPMHVRRA
jgi:hypothetical protein